MTHCCLIAGQGCSCLLGSPSTRQRHLVNRHTQPPSDDLGFPGHSGTRESAQRHIWSEAFSDPLLPTTMRQKTRLRADAVPQGPHAGATHTEGPFGSPRGSTLEWGQGPSDGLRAAHLPEGRGVGRGRQGFRKRQPFQARRPSKCRNDLRLSGVFPFSSDPPTRLSDRRALGALLFERGHFRFREISPRIGQ